MIKACKPRSLELSNVSLTPTRNALGRCPLSLKTTIRTGSEPSLPRNPVTVRETETKVRHRIISPRRGARRQTAAMAVDRTNRYASTRTSSEVPTLGTLPAVFNKAFNTAEGAMETIERERGTTDLLTNPREINFGQESPDTEAVEQE